MCCSSFAKHIDLRSLANTNIRAANEIVLATGLVAV
jgi:hypothetical protein